MLTLENIGARVTLSETAGRFFVTGFHKTDADVPAVTVVLPRSRTREQATEFAQRLLRTIARR